MRGEPEEEEGTKKKEEKEKRKKHMMFWKFCGMNEWLTFEGRRKDMKP